MPNEIYESDISNQRIHFAAMQNQAVHYSKADRDNHRALFKDMREYLFCGNNLLNAE